MASATIAWTVAIVAISLTLVGWALIYRQDVSDPERFRKNARICFGIAAGKIICGLIEVFVIGWELFGIILILFSGLWVMRGQRWNKRYQRQLSRRGQGGASSAVGAGPLLSSQNAGQSAGQRMVIVNGVLMTPEAATAQQRMYQQQGQVGGYSVPIQPAVAGDAAYYGGPPNPAVVGDASYYATSQIEGHPSAVDARAAETKGLPNYV